MNESINQSLSTHPLAQVSHQTIHVSTPRRANPASIHCTSTSSSSKRAATIRSTRRRASCCDGSRVSSSCYRPDPATPTNLSSCALLQPACGDSVVWGGVDSKKQPMLDSNKPRLPLNAAGTAKKLQNICTGIYGRLVSWAIKSRASIKCLYKFFYRKWTKIGGKWYQKQTVTWGNAVEREEMREPSQ